MIKLYKVAILTDPKWCSIKIIFPCSKTMARSIRIFFMSWPDMVLNSSTNLFFKFQVQQKKIKFLFKCSHTLQNYNMNLNNKLKNKTRNKSHSILRNCSHTSLWSQKYPVSFFFNILRNIFYFFFCLFFLCKQVNSELICIERLIYTKYTCYLYCVWFNIMYVRTCVHYLL